MSEQELAAVLWDMDGTLIDSEPMWLRAELAVLERYGIEMSAETHDRLIGSGLWDAAELFRELGVEMTADEIVAEWAASVGADLAREGAAWRPGAVELLASLADAGIPSALVTMSVRSLAELVVGLLPPGSFSAVVAGDDVLRAKPHPEPYLRGAAALGVAIEACVALEDSPTGLRSATASGAVAVGIPNLLPLDDVPAHALWRSLDGVGASDVRQQFARLRGGPAAINTEVIDVIGARA